MGAGTMGSGIALACAMKGFEVILYDAFDEMLEKAKKSIRSNLDFLESKSKISNTERVQIENNLHFTNLPDDCRAGLVIEAIVEKESAKTALFKELAAVNDEDCIFASNTSSLSISSIQEKIPAPHRVAGLHFFNPAHVMKLVEVISGNQTAPEVISELVAFCKKLDKVPVLCRDSHGFIVNRVARHYYLEAMKIVELGLADFETVDEVLEASGFKMGPFRLMDMIGMDINLAVSQSLYQAFGEERFKPSPLQEDKVAKGELGRKSGKGFYNY